MKALSSKQKSYASDPRSVDKLIQENLSLLGPKSPLRDACAYALLSGGKRLRPRFVFAIADALGNSYDVSYAALAIEFFHTASLVADDLPSMDDDAERRCQPSVHKMFGESTALLASYALIASGYACIAKNAQLVEKGALCSLAIENAAHNTGLYGATGGQYSDLSSLDPSFETIKEMIHKKTSSLFEVAFVFGWLFGGGKVEWLDDVKQTASHFGLAFQIVDDLNDRHQDEANGCSVNIVHVLGIDKAKKLLQQELFSLKLKSDALGLGTLQFQELISIF